MINPNLYYYSINLIRVIDGDTIVADINLGFELTLSSQSIRLLGINTPEIRGSQKEEGKIVKQFVTSFLKDKELMIHSFDKDNFGRILADIFYFQDDEWLSLCDLLISLNMGEPYHL